jgi:hypothetical protein
VVVFVKDDALLAVLIGKDAVAVETVGAVLAGLKPEKMPILQEFVKRNLGEGNMENIEIVGASFEDLRKRLAGATKAQKPQKAKHKGSTTWGGKAHQAFKNLPNCPPPAPPDGCAPANLRPL